MPIKQNPEKTIISSPETLPQVEHAPQPAEYSKSPKSDEKVNEQVVGKKIQTTLTSSTPSANFTRQVEGVMEENLEDIYQGLSDADKLIFKKKGEETASYISQLLQQTKVKIQEIFNALVKWLRYIPGISRAFIEQEAKIKTDALIKLKKK